MQPLKRDPAPSRWAWRLQRLMLTPVFRFGLRVGVPFALTFGGASLWLSVPENRTMVTDTVAEMRASIEERPEFMVNLMAIDGADAPLSTAIREAVPLDFPLSSFDLNLEDIRTTLAQMPPVQNVTVRIRPGGILQVDITPRTAAAIWRTADPQHFKEPRLETLTRKVTALLRDRFGSDDEAGGSIVEKCVIVMGTGFRVDI